MKVPLFDERHDVAGSDHAVRGMRPPREGFGADELARRDMHLWLELERERAPDPQLWPANQSRSDCEAVAHIVDRSAAHRQQRATVVIADVGQPAAIVRHEPRGESKPSDCFVEHGGDRILSDASDDQRERMVSRRLGDRPRPDAHEFRITEES